MFLSKAIFFFFLKKKKKKRATRLFQIFRLENIQGQASLGLRIKYL
jgi:hypothetical protein